ncbi:MAG TPA: hypothetical protein VFQ44_04635 [Streptosporangiaceae bacterium]|nr:hypothetical protein [Streptosporangiaceae bacterium]
MSNKVRAAGLLLGLAALAGCGTTSAGNASTVKVAGQATSGTVIKARHTNIGTVLTTASGMTVYWFSADAATSSRCSGGCAQYWPPVKGPVTLAPGVRLPGKFGTIKRTDGLVQATYDGHPLYTYLPDSGPGQTVGNMADQNGGLWWAMTPSGVRLGAPAAFGPTHSPAARQVPSARPSSATAPPPSSAPGGYGY